MQSQGTPSASSSVVAAPRQKAPLAPVAMPTLTIWLRLTASKRASFQKARVWSAAPRRAERSRRPEKEGAAISRKMKDTARLIISSISVKPPARRAWDLERWREARSMGLCSGSGPPGAIRSFT
jgi:hypothetical protein